MTGKNGKRLSKRFKPFDVLTWLKLAVVTLVFGYPLIFLLANSLRHYMSSKPILFFSQWHFENYGMAVSMIPFWQYLGNTLKLVVIVVGCSVVFDFLYGYAFARLRAPGKELIFKLVLLQLMIPYIAIQIPQFVFYKQIGLVNTFWIWVLSGIGGNAYLVFLVKQFMTAFPREIEEAAKIDGCSRFGLILRIFVPLSKPILGLIVFNQFCSAWNDYMGPYMFLSGKRMPLFTALFGNVYFLEGKREMTLEPVVMAACVLFSIPVVIILFFVLQRYLVEGIVTTGLKG